MIALVVFLSILNLALTEQVPRYEFLEEWNLWKSQHEKIYNSKLEELDRHMVWLSNKKFIELHNANSHIFGYSLAMNHFGDLVNNKVYFIKYLLLCCNSYVRLLAK